MKSIRTVAVAAIAVTALVAVDTGRSGAAPSSRLALEFAGEDIIPTGTQFEDTEVGGLSSMAYDERRDVYYALSDDQSVIDAARFYTLSIDLTDGMLDDGDVEVLAVTTLLDAAGLPFPARSFDPEGLTLTRDDRLVITSEGIANLGIAPWVRTFDLGGQQLGELPVPAPFLPTAPDRGVRAEPRLRECGRGAQRRSSCSSAPRGRWSRTARRPA